MLAVFAEFERNILRDRVKAGIAQTRREDRAHGRPPTAAKCAKQVRLLARKGLSKSEISRRLQSAGPQCGGSWPNLNCGAAKSCLVSEPSGRFEQYLLFVTDRPRARFE